MDSDRFDDLTRTVTATRSRRGALAALLGGSLPVLGLAEGEARKRRRRGKGKKKNGGNNSPPPPLPCNGVCVVPAICQAGSCCTPPGEFCDLILLTPCCSGVCDLDFTFKCP